VVSALDGAAVGVVHALPWNPALMGVGGDGTILIDRNYAELLSNIAADPILATKATGQDNENHDSHSGKLNLEVKC
jgi:hypothetical protein